MAVGMLCDWEYGDRSSSFLAAVSVAARFLVMPMRTSKSSFKFAGNGTRWTSFNRRQVPPPKMNHEQPLVLAQPRDPEACEGRCYRWLNWKRLASGRRAVIVEALALQGGPQLWDGS